MAREQAVEMVRRYDHVVPSDLQFWLNYVAMSEEEFWQTADRFRDPRVWWIEGAEWWKDNVWGTPSACEPVYLPADAQVRYRRRERAPRARPATRP